MKHKLALLAATIGTTAVALYLSTGEAGAMLIRHVPLYGVRGG